MAHLDHARSRSRLLRWARKDSLRLPGGVQSEPIRTFLSRNLWGSASRASVCSHTRRTSRVHQLTPTELRVPARQLRTRRSSRGGGAVSVRDYCPQSFQLLGDGTFSVLPVIDSKKKKSLFAFAFVVLHVEVIHSASSSQLAFTGLSSDL